MCTHTHTHTCTRVHSSATCNLSETLPFPQRLMTTRTPRPPWSWPETWLGPGQEGTGFLLQKPDELERHRARGALTVGKRLPREEAADTVSGAAARARWERESGATGHGNQALTPRGAASTTGETTGLTGRPLPGLLPAPGLARTTRPGSMWCRRTDRRGGSTCHNKGVGSQDGARGT